MKPYLTAVRLAAFSALLFIQTISFSQTAGSAISGFVTEEGDKPYEGAAIVITNASTGFTASGGTDSNGYFSFRDLPVGTYDVLVSAVGFQTTEIKGNILNLGDHLVLRKIKISHTSTTLTEVTVRSSSFQNSVDRLGTATAVSGKAMQKIPLQRRNYADLMLLSPLANGASLGGAKAGSTGYMLDGVSNRRATFGGLSDAAFSVSSETIREFEVNTNGYDVTNGRGSGGVVKAITKSGTNTLSGTLWSYYGANSLAAKKDVNGNPLTSQYETFQAGGLLSGPVIKDKLHFLLSYDQYRNSLPMRAFDFTYSAATQEQAEKNLGITKANLDQVIKIMNDQFGFPAGQEYGTIGIVQETKNAFAKFDWIINKKNLLTLKYNFLHFEDPDKQKGNGLLSTRYTGREINHQAMLALRTEFSAKVTNELRLNYSTYRKYLDFVNNHVPEGFVNVESVFSDGSAGNKMLAFGNQNWVPERDASDVVQIIDNVRFRKGNLNYVFGTDNNFNFISDRLSHDQQGQFYYHSINDMANNNPYRFNRKIPLNGANPAIRVPLLESGIFGQAETNIRPNLNLTLGLRWDVTIVGGKPTYNAQLEKDLGIRTDVTPVDLKNVQPRVNLIWDVKSNGRDVVKFGAGLFAGEFTTQAVTNSRIDNGIDFRQVDIRAHVPTPDWKAYQSDFSKVPGTSYYNSLATKQPATVLALDKNLKNPLTFKTNLSYYHYLNDWLRVGGNVYYSNTWDNVYLYDANLKRNPEFITNEGREVYVPARTLTADGANSVPNYVNSRQSPNFNQVRIFTNTPWSSKYVGGVVEAAAQMGDGHFSVSYALSKAVGTPPYDSGDPRNANFSVASSYWTYASYGKDWYSDGNQRHKIVALFLSPSFRGFSISSSFQAYQNRQFSAYVDRDVIGMDNNGTNLAYIFDPNNPTTPENIKLGMQTLLQNTSPEFRKYLEDNMGGFAPYLGGFMPWRTQWNISLAKEIKTHKTQKVSLRADIYNVLNFIHHKWGGYNQIVNTTLYNVTGFDPAANSYRYNVNTNAGARQKTADYFTVQFGVRYSF